MANTSVFITAGLPIAKDSGQLPCGGNTSAFITAGLPKIVEAGREYPTIYNAYPDAIAGTTWKIQPT